MKNKNITIIGLGPEAKKTYIPYIKNHKINLKLIVDLKKNENEIKKYLEENDINAKTYLLDDKYKDCEYLPREFETALLKILKKLDINYMIISTEPKSHFMYLKFGLKNNINILVEKPLTVSKDMSNIKNIKKIKKQYKELVKLYDKSKSNCMIMCQRKYHRGYEYVKNILKEIVGQYNIPITYIDIYHCDGNWEMPHDLDKENHPYKYGYGKLFHSGYHFIDLLSEYLKINNLTTDNKRLSSGEIYSKVFTPNDELGVFTIEDYQEIFKNQNIPKFYNKKMNFAGYGEKNVYSLMTFKNMWNQTITTANLNLLHYGYSRRGWIESREFYDQNGRVRHERINIQVGPLMNIQIHNYQYKVPEERTLLEQETKLGGLEHFDIHIYRNVDIIGGKPYEKISQCDLFGEDEKKNITEYSILPRIALIDDFLNDKKGTSDLKNHFLAIEILETTLKSIHYKKTCKFDKSLKKW